MLSIEKKILIFFTLFLSLMISFHLGENSSGGSKHDYLNTEIYINAFKIDFFSGLEIFKSRDEMHSPFFYIIVANLSKIFGDTLVKYFYLIISSLIPLIFYMSLKKKFLRTNFDYLFFLSLLIFLSPYFRSSAVWLTTDNLALLIATCLFLSLICQLGDLFISFFKRQADVKDTGSLLPGHGGLLDRIDGAIFVLPVAFIIDKIF